MSSNKWGRFVLNTPDKAIVRFETLEQERTTEAGLVLPRVWTKDIGEGAARTNVTYEREKITDIAQVLAVGPSFYDSNGNFVEQPCKVGDRVWSNGTWGRAIPDPAHEGPADPTTRLVRFSDILAIVEDDGDD